MAEESIKLCFKISSRNSLVVTEESLGKGVVYSLRSELLSSLSLG